MKTLSLLLLSAVAFSCTTTQPWNPDTKAGSDSQPKAVEASATAPASARTGMLVSSLAFPTGNEKTSAILIEKHVPKEVRVGQAFEYETLVTNLTSLPLENVVVTESVSPGFTVASTTPKLAGVEQGMNRWMIDKLAPGQTKSIVVRGTAKQAEAVRNCVSVSYQSALCTSIPITNPALAVTIDGPAEVIQCDEIVYTYVVTNTGTGTAENLELTSQLPQGILSSGKSGLMKRIASLDAGESTEFEVEAKASRTGEFKHLVSVKGANGLTAKSTEVVTTVRKPKLEITMTGPDKLFFERDLTYEILVKNVGDGVARDAMLEDRLPTGAKFASATQEGRASGNRVRWELGDIPAGETRKVSVRLEPSQIGRFQSLASVKAYCADEVTAQVETEVTGIPAILLEVIDVDDPTPVGQNETYVITATNQGSAPATNVKIRIQLPDNVEFVTAAGTTMVTGNPTASRSIELKSVASIAAGKKADWRITVKAVKAGDARFKVSMTSDQLTSPVDETEATYFYE